MSDAQLIAQYHHHRKASEHWGKKAEEFLFSRGPAAINYSGFKEYEQEANMHTGLAIECFHELSQRGVSPF